MKKVAKPVSVSFNIKLIRVVEFSISNRIDVANFDVSKVRFRVSVNLVFNIEANTVGIQTTVEVFADISETYKICTLVTLTEFSVLEMSKIVSINSKQINFPDALAHHLLSLALSTTRGILVSKTEGTILHNSYMPIIDPKELMRQAQTNNL